jgi:hypothetical protein
MHHANIPLIIQNKVFKEAFTTSTPLLDGFMPITIIGTVATRYVHFFGSHPGFVQHLHIWGEAGTI